MPIAMHVWALACHIEATTAVRVGCMGAEDKMAGNTHALQRWSLLHACHNTGHSSAKCDKARRQLRMATQPSGGDSDSTAHTKSETRLSGMPRDTHAMGWACM